MPDSITVAAFVQHADSLIQHMDSVAAQIQAVSAAPTGLDVVDRVEAMYERRWSQLLWFVGIAVAFVGVLTLFLQRAVLRLQQRRISADIARQGREARDALRETDDQIRRDVDDIALTLERRISKALAGVMHNQAARHFEEERYRTSVVCLLQAVWHDAKAADAEGLEEDLARLASTLPHAESPFETWPKRTVEHIDDTLKALRASDAANKLTEHLVRIEQLRGTVLRDNAAESDSE